MSHRIHNLKELDETFEALKESIRAGKPGEGANLLFLKDIDLSLRQALVLAWLMDHKDYLYTIEQMGRELGMNESAAKAVVCSLLETECLSREGEDIDVPDYLFFMILDMQAAKASGIIKSWKDYGAH